MGKGKNKQQEKRKTQKPQVTNDGKSQIKPAGPSGKRIRSQKFHDLSGNDDDWGVRELTHQLKEMGLYAKVITGDGNCLFRALSDQHHGTDTHHAAIRQEVCDYLERNRDTYQFFVEDDGSFDAHLTSMRKGGTYGGNMELVAYARLKGVDIKVYRPGFVYVILGIEDNQFDIGPPRETLHIAYHSWEHYSSVRNSDGPHHGPPVIKITKTEIPPLAPISDDDPPTFSEKAIISAFPNASLVEIRRLMRQCKGDPNRVIEILYDEEADVAAAVEATEMLLAVEQAEVQHAIEESEMQLAVEAANAAQVMEIEQTTQVIETAETMQSAEVAEVPQSVKTAKATQAVEVAPESTEEEVCGEEEEGGEEEEEQSREEDSKDSEREADSKGGASLDLCQEGQDLTMQSSNTTNPTFTDTSLAISLPSFSVTSPKPPSSLSDTTTTATEMPAPKQGTKRMTNRERKALAKQKQKENSKMKKAAGATTQPRESEESGKKKQEGGGAELSKGMKQLYI